MVTSHNLGVSEAFECFNPKSHPRSKNFTFSIEDGKRVK